MVREKRCLKPQDATFDLLTTSLYLLVIFAKSFFGLGGSGLKIQVVLDGNRTDKNKENVVPMHHTPSWKLRKNPFWRIGSSVATVPTSEAGSALLYAYEASEDIGGKVLLMLPPGKKADHLGIKIQFIGRIDMVGRMYDGIKFLQKKISQ